MRSIKRCDICGYAFKTLEKRVDRYHDGEEWKEIVAYPDPTDPNPPHLVRNYVCDKCYQDIGNVMRHKLIKEGEDFVKDLPLRIEEEYKNLKTTIKKLECDAKKIQDICQRLKSADHLFELSNEEIKLIKEYGYKPFETYYLDDAIKIEKMR